ncbi:LOW QUALITY PROTEIN: peptidase, M23/M37 family [Brevundimonas abyssalis TAR-001]|uniref:Peptidase, M23/M37 family n=1 Tax=Brevundimonas abyssalis TAR-001 TaxID=1391729 RepID=A0A8E0NBL2_9CAUL|nr:LOW QUALITY PROTEIN: peptidase, M23/M37 family [Brevundimonas abyssalis TAR-001]
MIAARRSFLLGAGALGLAGPAWSREGLALDGRFVQGGFAMGRTWPRAIVFVDGEALTTASAAGLFIVGFDRDAAASARIEVLSGVRRESRDVTIAPGDFAITRIDGLPPQTVTPTAPEVLARIQREAALKTEASASRADADHFNGGFIRPLETWRVTSRWGAQRVLNGTPARPHYGIDLGAPTGTVIRAPADGLVTLAEPDLHFEGGLTLIDHGQGLISAYLHQSRLDVRPGERVVQGQAIGRVGASGRATGPHLCWRLKWRDRNLDPSLLVGAEAPPPA